MAMEPTALTPVLQQKLLQIARATIETYLRTHAEAPVTVAEPELQTKCGAFVTLKTHGNLRGCIGMVEGFKPLYQTIVEMAVAAATEDPRFPPVQEHELAELSIEISVMTPLQQVARPEDVEVGKHGILLRRGRRSGLLLPQVATEYHWDRDTFLDHTCLKAGLPSQAWKEPDTEIYVFSAQVFHETEPHD